MIAAGGCGQAAKCCDEIGYFLQIIHSVFGCFFLLLFALFLSFFLCFSGLASLFPPNCCLFLSVLKSFFIKASIADVRLFCK